MGHTYTATHYHVVFGIKGRVPAIRPDIQARLYDYIGGILRSENGVLIAIGGMFDHIHLLATFPPTTCVADMVRRIKANSSKWMHENLREMEAFRWQTGYAAFTVSHSILGDVEAYIGQQEARHTSLSFEDEFIAFLVRHDIQYDKRYVLG